MISVSFSIACLVFLTIISIFYFTKKRLKNIDNKIFTILIILNLIGIIIDVYGYFSFKTFGTEFILNILISKIYLIYYLSYAFCLMIYIFNITFKNLNKVLTYLIIGFLILCVIIFILPIDVYMQGNTAFSYGPSVNLGYTFAFIFIIAMIVSLIKNIKRIRSKEFVPIFVFIVLTFLTLVVQKINPEITLLLLSNSVVTTLMYFTIENPDIKLINELNENKILVEKTNEEKSKILFKMIQEVKNPVSYIYNVSESLENEDNSEKLKKGIGVINSSARKLSYIINNVLDVSGMDVKRVKVINNKYNIYTLLDEIKVRLEKRRKANVEYRVNISNNIPETLYGDPIKVKQILATILSNAIEHTDSGFIELTIDALVRYDMCRLIITIEDSGVGMNLVKVNEILRFDEELSSEDEEKLQNRYLDLKLVKKMLKFLGGTMMIKSEVGKGSEFIVVLDQKIENPKNDNYSQRYNSTSLFETKRVLIVDDDMEELENIANKFKKDNIDVTTTLYGKDCVDKINSKENYDLILIDDEMPDLSGLGTLKELQKIEGFKIPTAIMFNNDKLRIKDSYLEDGFKDYLLKEKIRSESERLIDKYL